jgi:hypothetical protein
VRENFASKGNAPSRCSICTVSRQADGLVDNIDLPSVYLAYSGPKIDC